MLPETVCCVVVRKRRKNAVRVFVIRTDLWPGAASLEAAADSCH